MKHLLYILSLVLCMNTPTKSPEHVTHDLKKSLQNEQLHFVALSEDFEKVSRQMEADLERDRKYVDDLSVRLYACKLDYVFDLTFLLKQVELEYHRLEGMSKPNHSLIRRCELEVNRYDKLLTSLGHIEDLPEDWEPVTEHDTIALYAQNLKTYYERVYAYEHTRSQQYEELRQSFYDTYDYARTRYEEVHTMVIQGTENQWWRNMPDFSDFAQFAIYDAVSRSQVSDNLTQTGEIWIILCEMLGGLLFWVIILLIFLHCPRLRERFPRMNANPVIWCNLAWVITELLLLILDTQVLELNGLINTGATFYGYLIYVCMIQIALLLREEGEKASMAMHMYAPTLFMGFMTIFMRLFMLPSSTMQLVYGPEVLITLIWQFSVLVRYWDKSAKIDTAFASLSVFALLVIFCYAIMGSVFMAIQLFFFWMMEAGILLMISTIYSLLNLYGEQMLKNRIARFRQLLRQEVKDEDIVQVTWFYKMVKMVILPLAVIMSLPVCIYFALDLFNAGNNYLDLFNRSFYDLEQNGDLVLSVSLRNLTIILSLFFVFYYLKDIIISIYHQIRISIACSNQEDDEMEDYNTNVALGDNLIPIIVWIVYIVNCFVLLRIPLSTLTFIFAGLATGIGFAMRDVINNIIYGIQLMAGRLHVGDYIICGNYRGDVTDISYQTTQMHTEEGALVNFSNADLFGKNFQNLTRQNPYEVNRIEFKVAYNKDIADVEQLVTEAMRKLNRREHGVPLLSAQEGIRVELRDMSDAGCEFAVRFGVIAGRRTWFLPVARKAIYETLVANGYDIPFTKYELIGKQIVKS